MTWLRGRYTWFAIFDRVVLSIYMAELLCCVPETTTTLLPGYIPDKVTSFKKREIYLKIK